MADFRGYILPERNTEQAIAALKKGTYLLKYGRRGKPKFFPFCLSSDETCLIWYSGKKEKQLKLSIVSKIIPGQRTAIFQRYPQPEKEYQSFSLIYGGRSLDLICKDKDEAEIWFAALQALISRGNTTKSRCDSRSDSISSDSMLSHSQRNSTSNLSSTSSEILCKEGGEAHTLVPSEKIRRNRLVKAFSEVLSYTAATKAYPRAESVAESLDLLSSDELDNLPSRCSAVDSFRSSLSSVVSSSSQGSYEDFNALYDVLIWGEGIGNGLLGGGIHRIGTTTASGVDALLPRTLKTTAVLDARSIACGNKHAVLVTKQGQIYSWGEGTGGGLGHGVEADVSHPKLIEALGGSTIESAACGEFHTCAVTLSGDLYTWGDGSHNCGLLGLGSDGSHWKPMRVFGQMEGIYVSYVSCGPWHTAAVTSAGKLYTFGQGSFGALGHGDRNSTSIPREVETLRGLRTVRTSCGVWHSAAVVEVSIGDSDSGRFLSGKLFTWGDGDKGQLGHGDKEPRLIPSCVSVSDDTSFCQVACGQSMTVALTASGQVYCMGIADYGQLGNLGSIDEPTACIGDNISNSYIEEIACGSHHIAALGSKAEVYTWGKGANGQLGHGDNESRIIPTLVIALRGKQVKRLVCGSNYTAAICLQKSISSVDHSRCSGCRIPFNFRRRRHNCYNCGLAFCNACSSKKSLRAAMAPNMNKPFRVCAVCFEKIKEDRKSISASGHSRSPSGNKNMNRNEVDDKQISNTRSLRRLSRLTSFDSFRQAKSQHFKRTVKGDLNIDAASIVEHPMPTSLPNSRRGSPATSPVSLNTRALHSVIRTSAYTDVGNPDFILNGSMQTDICFTEELDILRAQVEDLTRKSQLLEAELEKTSRRLKEATATAEEEAEKNKASKEVIRSLTMQLTDMSGRLSGKLTLRRKSF